MPCNTRESFCPSNCKGILRTNTLEVRPARYSANATAAAEGALLDVLVLAEAAAFIGTHTSALSKAAYLLAV